jgi:hypothetical protein
MIRPRYEQFRARLFALQQRVPDHVQGEYESVLAALVNARYCEATRHFGWLRAARRHLRIADRALGEIDETRPQPDSWRAPFWHAWQPVIRWLCVAAASLAIATSAFLVGLHYNPAPAPIRPSQTVVQTATNGNAVSGDVTVSNNTTCGIGAYCGDATDGNSTSGDDSG